MVAILLSTYNGEKFLKEQLDSVLDQDFEEWKMFVRDDGSSDSTVQIIQKYALLDPRIVFFEKDKEKLGAAMSFMQLLSVVEANYYLFCDQDDFWFPNKISVLLNEIKTVEKHRPNTPALVFSDCTVADEHLQERNPSFWKYSKLNPQLYRKNSNYISVFNAVPGCTMMINNALKKVLPKLSGAILMHDWFLMIVAVKNNFWKAVNQPLMLYRQHDTNALGADENVLQKKVAKGLGNPMKQLSKSDEVFYFVSKYLKITKAEYLWLKCKFNLQRYWI